jgi:hypothetical protein
MKIREGFVSNSSSQSFVISTKDFSSVRELATYMIKKQMQDRDDLNISCERRIKNLELVDENQSVSFPSCNYDTYIRRVGDAYLVATCNNTTWDLYDYCLNKLPESTKEELKEMQKNPFYMVHDRYNTIDYILDGEIYDFSHFGVDFYDLERNVIGVQTFEECRNVKDGRHQNWNDRYMWETPKYGKICLICNPYYQRKDKLDQINKKNRKIS